ncbi:MAG: hypothetical protein ACRCWQ_11070 [Bacilli bacterium]
MTVKEFMKTQPILNNYIIKPKRLMHNRTIDAFDNCTIKKVELDIDHLIYDDCSALHLWVLTIDANEVV